MDAAAPPPALPDPEGDEVCGRFLPKPSLAKKPKTEAAKQRALERVREAGAARAALEQLEAARGVIAAALEAGLPGAAHDRAGHRWRGVRAARRCERRKR